MRNNSWEYILDKLECLTDGPPDQFKAIWKDLRPRLSGFELATLRQDYENSRPTSEKAIKELIDRRDDPRKWVEGRIAALRVYALLERDKAYPKLSELVADRDELVDVRAWALYDLLLIGKRVDKKCWGEFRKPVTTGLDAPEQYFRQWAAYLLGEMGRDQRDPGNSFFEKDVRKEAERLLRDRWKKEINLYTDRQIVISLGLVGGNDLDPESKDQNGHYAIFPIVRILNEATDHVNGEVKKLVPDAVASVANNVAHCGEYDATFKAQVIGQLLGVLYDWLIKALKEHPQHVRSKLACRCDEDIKLVLTRLKEVWSTIQKTVDLSDTSPLVAPIENHACLFKCAEEILSTPGLLYDSYRQAITTIADIVHKSPPSSNQLVENGIDQLLKISETPQPKEARDSLHDQVRARAVAALGDLARPSDKDGKEALRKKVKGLILTRQTYPYGLEEMLADPKEEVCQEVKEALITLMEKQEATEFFTDIILKDEKLRPLLGYRRLWEKAQTLIDDVEKARIRTRAAQGLALLGQRYKSNDGDPSTYAGLLSALHRYQGSEYGRAYEALRVIGGEEGINALVESNMREYVNERYFKPMEAAEEESKPILKDLVENSKISFYFTLGVATVAALAGMSLLESSISKMSNTSSTEWESVTAALSGLILALAGILTPFFWNSAQAVQKANGQMTNLITAFHGYLGRMRLVGLGFAHAYSAGTENQEHADFAVAMSNAAGQAMIDSSRVLESIGRGPLVETNLTSVPNFVGESKPNATKLADGKSLTLVFKSDNHDKAEKDTVFAQDIRAATEVKQGTVVNLTLSLGPKETSSKTSP